MCWRSTTPPIERGGPGPVRPGRGIRYRRFMAASKSLYAVYVNTQGV